MKIFQSTLTYCLIFVGDAAKTGKTKGHKDTKSHGKKKTKPSKTCLETETADEDDDVFFHDNELQLIKKRKMKSSSSSVLRKIRKVLRRLTSTSDGDGSIPYSDDQVFFS